MKKWIIWGKDISSIFNLSNFAPLICNDFTIYYWLDKVDYYIIILYSVPQNLQERCQNEGTTNRNVFSLKLQQRHLTIDRSLTFFSHSMNLNEF
jgi:hypothetical protein